MWRIGGLRMAGPSSIALETRHETALSAEDHMAGHFPSVRTWTLCNRAASNISTSTVVRCLYLGTRARHIRVLTSGFVDIKGDYNTYTAKNGEFTTWLKMKAWLLETYSPVDLINTYRDAFFLSTRQRVGESPDNFYR